MQIAAPRSRTWAAALGRGATYFVVWMVIAGGDADDILPGLGAAALATWASLRLMPPDPLGGSVRWLEVLRLFARFVRVSVLAGLDVARRALAPRMRLAPGYVHYQPQLPPSDARSLFQAMTSQMPGTIPSGTEPSGAIAYHCLDASRSVAGQLAEEESRLLDALGGALGAAEVVTKRTRSDA
ncbi:MAG: sodium:proton antiporter [Gammaproteobacteria bacterium]|nr:sodium:proton antiporter [Gammaproteobacteria bacterium]